MRFDKVTYILIGIYLIKFPENYDEITIKIISR